MPNCLCKAYKVYYMPRKEFFWNQEIMFFSLLSFYVDVWTYHCQVDVFFNAKKFYEPDKYDVSRFSVEVSTTRNVR